MDDKDRIKIVSGVDIFVAIFLLITGILIVIFSAGWLDAISDSSGYTTNTWMNTIPWIILTLGITSIVYGIKRMIDDILKILILKPSHSFQQPRYPPPIQQPPAYQQQMPQQPRQ